MPSDQSSGESGELQTDDQSSGWTRRGALQTFGLAAVAGSTASAGKTLASTSSEPTRPATTTSGGSRGILPVGQPGYDTIHDALNAARAGDVIRVLGSYDAQEAGETFPITLDYSQKPVALTGTHPSNAVIDAGSADANVIEVIGVGSDDYLNQPEVRDLRIRGGQIGLRVRGAPFASFQNLFFQNTGSHGTLIDEYTNSSGLPLGTFGSIFSGCQAWNCGGDGFSTVQSAQSHATYYIGCRATANRGVGFRLMGYSSKLLGGISQLNYSYGVSARHGGSITIDSCYIEGNGRGESFPIEVLAAGTTSTVVQNSYFHGINPRPTPGHDYDLVQRGVNFYQGDHGVVKTCTAYSYGEGFIAPIRSTDIDVNYSTHSTSGTADVLTTTDFQGVGSSRVRSKGTILPTDLSQVDGAFDGDVGFHVSNEQEGPAYWRNGEWHLATTQPL